MNNAVEIDMNEWLAVDEESLQVYYRGINVGTVNNQSPLNLGAEAQKTIESTASWCGFDRAPRSLGELEVLHRFYLSFKTLEKHAEANKYTPTWAADPSEARSKLFEFIKKFHPKLHRAFKLRDAGEHVKLTAWLAQNEVLSTWSTKPSFVALLPA